MKEKNFFLDYNYFEKLYFKKKRNININFELLYHKKKYNFFLKELTYKFNALVNKKYSQKFWNIVIGKFIYYHLHQCQEVFNSLKNAGKIRKKKIKIINPKFFKTPLNLIDYQNFIQCSELGRMQIFSILIKENFSNNKILFYKNKITFQKNKKEFNLKKNNIKFNFLLKKVRNFIYKKIRNPALLVSGCFWSIEEKINIQYKSYGRIIIDNFFIAENEKTSFDEKLRNKIFSSRKYSNDFDKFFFETLKYCCPKSIIENLNYRINKVEAYLDRNKNLKYILNENLSEDNLILMGVAKNRDIKNIYCEHNTLMHPFKQNWISFIASIFDKYFTLGWKSKNKKFFAGGSLFPWINLKNYQQSKNKKILFIPSISIKRTLFNSSIYGEDSFNNESYFNINKLFFSNINKKICKEMIYKKYPNLVNFSTSYYEKKIYELVKSKNIKIINNNKRLIDEDFNNSKLIVVNYLKTSLIQSIKSNVPTIIFYNNNSYDLKRDLKFFFNDLVEVSIIHNNPLSAAKFINKIGHDPFKWWNSKKTKKARQKFILRNFKSGGHLKKLILDFA